MVHRIESPGYDRLFSTAIVRTDLKREYGLLHPRQRPVITAQILPKLPTNKLLHPDRDRIR